jgi:hypothetical protein
MKKTLLLAALGTLTCALPSQATNISVIDFGGGTENAVTLAGGTALTNAGHTIRIGYFNTAAQTGTWASDIKSLNLANITSALASFIPLGENSVGQPVLGTGAGTATGPRVANRVVNAVQKPGRLIGQITDVNPVVAPANTVNAAGVPAGSRIFMLVYSDNDSVLHNGEQFGVFSADNWLLDPDGTLSLSLNMTDANTAAEVFRGTLNAASLRTEMAAIAPEPSTGIMALFAGLGMLARRRRK